MDEALQFVERFAGRGWLEAWLSSGSDRQQAIDLEQRLRNAMQDFQVRARSWNARIANLPDHNLECPSSGSYDQAP